MAGPVVVASTDPTAIESGNSWNGLDTAGAPVIVTFSFPTALPAYDATIAGFTTGTIASFTQFTSAEKQEALAALDQWAAASGIIFVQVAPGQGDITFGNVDFSTTTPSPQNGDFSTAGGIGFYPFGNWSYSTGSSSGGYGFTSDLSPAGAIFMNSQYITNGSVSAATLLHEIGHAIGMKHPDQVVYTEDGVAHDEVLNSTLDSSTITIMSETVDAANTVNPTLLSLDKAAAAALYGPAGTGGVYTSSASGINSVSKWTWNATTNTLTQTAVSANETIHGTSVDDIIYGFDYGDATPTSGNNALFGLDGTNIIYAGSGTTELYGGPGTNTLVGGAGDDSFYVYSQDTTVTDAYTTGNNTLYETGVSFTLPENVNTLYIYGAGLTGTGNNQNDSIFGDGIYSDTLVAGSGDDYMVGGSGGNTLVAGAGIDTMYGGAGTNHFVYAPGDGPVGNTYGVDYIGDFKPGTDKIDLSAFAAAGHQFTFDGSSPLTGPGQLEVFTTGGNTFVEGDVTSHGAADFEIELKGTLNLQATDFILTPDVTCFCRGTRIRTPSGDVAIETLRRGDLLITMNGGVSPIIWLGKQTISTRFADRLRVLPIRVKKGALGDNAPARDLLISPDHAIFLQEVLLHAGALVNGVSIIREDDVPEVFVYYHIETEDHSLIYAENVAVETFIDNVDRLGFDNWAEHEAMYPEGRHVEELPYPRAKSKRQVPTNIRKCIADRISSALSRIPEVA